jgi:hypothetical protein
MNQTPEEVLLSVEKIKLLLIKMEKEREMIRERFKLLPLDDIYKNSDNLSSIYDRLSDKKKLECDKFIQDFQEHLELYAPIQSIREKRKLMYQQIMDKNKKSVSAETPQVDVVPLHDKSTSMQASTNRSTVLDYKNIHYVVR